MRNSFYTSSLPLAIVLLATSASFAQDIEVTSKIEAVTVYPDAATVTRRLEVDLPAGASNIIIKGLPATVDPNSVRVEGAADGKLAIASVDAKLVPGNPATAADPALMAVLNKLKAEREAVQGQIEAADLQKSAVQRYAQAGPEQFGKGEKPIDVAEWPKAWAAVGEGLAKVNERLQALRTEAKRLDGEIVAAQRAQPGGVRPGTPLTDVKVAVESGAALKAKLTITYRVSNARWTALYDARLATTGPDKPRLELVRRASVTQRSGEDWGDVALQLSTVRLNRGTSAPVVTTQTVNLFDPVVLEEVLTRQKTRAAAPLQQDARRAEPMLEKADAEIAKPPSPAGPVVATQISATLDAGAYQAQFIVPGKVNVPQDGTEKSFTLGSKIIDPDMLIRTAPSLDATAYIEAAFINEEEAPLLPGLVMIHRDGTFIGRGNVKLVAPGDRATLGFGADDAVKITRVPVKKRENDGGFFGNTRTDTQDFKTTIRNLHNFGVKLAVVDRLPVSENTAVIIDALSTNTPPTEKTVEDKRGVMAWNFDLKPNEAKDIRLGWRLKWPADREINYQVR